MLNVFIYKVLVHQFAVFYELLNTQKCLNLFNHFVENLENSADLNLKFKIANSFFASRVFFVWKEKMIYGDCEKSIVARFMGLDITL